MKGIKGMWKGVASTKAVKAVSRPFVSLTKAAKLAKKIKG